MFLSFKTKKIFYHLAILILFFSKSVLVQAQELSDLDLLIEDQISLIDSVKEVSSERSYTLKCLISSLKTKDSSSCNNQINQVKIKDRIDSDIQMITNWFPEINQVLDRNKNLDSLMTFKNVFSIPTRKNPTSKDLDSILKQDSFSSWTNIVSTFFRLNPEQNALHTSNMLLDQLSLDISKISALNISELDSDTIDDLEYEINLDISQISQVFSYINNTSIDLGTIRSWKQLDKLFNEVILRVNLDLNTKHQFIGSSNYISFSNNIKELLLCLNEIFIILHNYKIIAYTKTLDSNLSSSVFEFDRTQKLLVSDFMQDCFQLANSIGFTPDDPNSTCKPKTFLNALNQYISTASTLSETDFFKPEDFHYMLKTRNLFIKNVINPILTSQGQKEIQIVSLNTNEKEFEVYNQTLQRLAQSSSVPDELISYTPFYDEDCTKIEKGQNSHWFKSYYWNEELSNLEKLSKEKLQSISFDFSTESPSYVRIFKEGSSISHALSSNQSSFYILSIYKALESIYTNYIHLNVLLDPSYINSDLQEFEKNLTIGIDNLIDTKKLFFNSKDFSSSVGLKPFKLVREDGLSSILNLVKTRFSSDGIDHSKLDTIRKTYMENLTQASDTLKELEKKLSRLQNFDLDTSISKILNIPYEIQVSKNKDQDIRFFKENIKYALYDYIYKAYPESSLRVWNYIKNYWNKDSEFNKEWKSERHEGDPSYFTTEEILYAWYNYLSQKVYKNDPSKLKTIDKIYAKYNLLIPIKLINLRNTSKILSIQSKRVLNGLDINANLNQNQTPWTPMEQAARRGFTDLGEIDGTKFGSIIPDYKEANKIIRYTNSLKQEELAFREQADIILCLASPLMMSNFIKNSINPQIEDLNNAINFIYTNFPPLKYMKEKYPNNTYSPDIILKLYKQFLEDKMNEYYQKIESIFYQDGLLISISNLNTKYNDIEKELKNSITPNLVLMQRVLLTNPEFKSNLCRIQKDIHDRQVFWDTTLDTIAVSSVFIPHPLISSVIFAASSLTESGLKISRAIKMNHYLKEASDLSIASSSHQSIYQNQNDNAVIDILTTMSQDTTKDALITTAASVTLVGVDLAVLKYSKLLPKKPLAQALSSSKLSKSSIKGFFKERIKLYKSDMAGFKNSYQSSIKAIENLRSSGRINGFGCFNRQVENYVKFKYKQLRRVLELSGLVGKPIEGGWIGYLKRFKKLEDDSIKMFILKDLGHSLVTGIDILILAHLIHDTWFEEDPDKRMSGFERSVDSLWVLAFLTASSHSKLVVACLTWIIYQESKNVVPKLKFNLTHTDQNPQDVLLSIENGIINLPKNFQDDSSFQKELLSLADIEAKLKDICDKNPKDMSLHLIEISNLLKNDPYIQSIKELKIIPKHRKANFDEDGAFLGWSDSYGSDVSMYPFYKILQLESGSSVEISTPLQKGIDQLKDVSKKTVSLLSCDGISFDDNSKDESQSCKVPISSKSSVILYHVINDYYQVIEQESSN